MRSRTWMGLFLLGILAAAAVGCQSDGTSASDKRALDQAAAKRAYDADPDAYHEPLGAD